MRQPQNPGDLVSEATGPRTCNIRGGWNTASGHTTLHRNSPTTHDGEDTRRREGTPPSTGTQRERIIFWKMVGRDQKGGLATMRNLVQPPRRRGETWPANMPGERTLSCCHCYRGTRERGQRTARSQAVAGHSRGEGGAWNRAKQPRCVLNLIAPQTTA